MRLVLGFDGRVRDLTVLERRPRTDNPHYRTPASRLLGKLWLVARGEKWSEEELLARVLDSVFDGVLGSLVPVFPLIGDLELVPQTRPALAERPISEAMLDLDLSEPPPIIASDVPAVPVTAPPAAGQPVGFGMSDDKREVRFELETKPPKR